MYIKELTADEFKNFTINFNMQSIYQTPEYGFVMNNQKFESSFLGLVDEKNNILGASIILIEKKNKFKYAYAPRGFLIDYNDEYLLTTFTNEIKKYLGKRNVIAVKLCPMIIKNTYDKKYNVKNKNNYFNNIFENLKKLEYYHYGFNNYFEALKPRYEAVIDLDLPYYMLFNNIKKQFKTKIRSAEKKGVKVYKGTEKNLQYLYLQTANKYPRDLEYFKDCYKYFKKDNQIEFFFTKLDTEKYLKYINKKYIRQENICNKLNKMLNNNNNDKIIDKKIYNDKLLNKYKQELVKATNYLKNNPNGIITSSILIVKTKDEAYILIDGYDSKYKEFNSKHLLIWKLIERYSKEGIKRFNLGGMTNPELENNEYKGLNDFKFGFNAKCIEYIGDIEITTNNTLYFMYKNTFPIRQILKR